MQIGHHQSSIIRVATLDKPAFETVLQLAAEEMPAEVGVPLIALMCPGDKGAMMVNVGQQPFKLQPPVSWQWMCGPIFFGVIFWQQLVSPKNGLRVRLGLGGNLHRPLKSTGSSLEFHEAKAFHPLAELMELRRQWRVPLAGDFHERWWRSTRRGWWLLTRWLLRKC